MKDYYRTISKKSYGEYKEKGSKFLAYAYPASSEEEVEEHLLSLKKEHPKARHHCYGYRLGTSGDLFRANDDGEPSGTAGRPILGSIDRHEISDTLVIVARYFGGTKLGASGLIQAYKAASDEALDNADIKIIYQTDRYLIDFEYSHMGIIMDQVKQLDIPIVESRLEASPSMIVEIRQSEAELKVAQLKSALLHWPVKDINEDTAVDFCKIEKI